MPLSVIREELLCSESTARRVIQHMRDRLGAPLEYDRECNGWYLDTAEQEAWLLPGLWFSVEETYALLASHQLLNDLQPGFLSSYINPLRDRLHALLTHKHCGNSEIANRIRILQMASRPTDLKRFQRVASAVLQRHKLRILYHGRERDRTTERLISPQRLVYYRSNWYLDAFCHLRNALRSFALDRLHPVEILDDPAREIRAEQLDAHFTGGYGIFAGEPRQTAHLRFTPEATRWVADEQWHPQQQGTVLPDGGYELRVPYSDPRELIMDILKYGPNIEVVGPAKLRRMVMEKLSAALGNYQG